MMTMKTYLIAIICALVSMNGYAQSDRQQIRSGNKKYRQQKYVNAEEDYRKALSANPNNPQALYNLGCALMMQQKDSLAIEEYVKATNVEKSKIRKSKIYHNMGVIYQNRKMFDKAIEAYKESLRVNPTDNETRYNLALCMKQLKNQPQNDNQNQNNQDDKKDNKNDKKQEKQKQQKQNQQPDKKEQMSKDNAEQLLNAAMQAEKETKQKIENAARRQSSRRLQKNW